MITIVSQLRCANGNYSTAIQNPTATDAQVTADGIEPVVSVPTTAAGTAISYGSLIAPGWAEFVNLDANNYVEIGLQVAGTFYPLLKLNPGMSGGPLYVADSVALYWRSHTAACLVQMLMLDR